MEELETCSDYKLLILWLLNNLKKKKSIFLQESYEELRNCVNENFNEFEYQPKSKRNQKLLDRSKHEPREDSKVDKFESSLNNLDNEQCKDVLKKWLRFYSETHLTIETDKFEQRLFILNSKNITNRISPDIQGKMTYSLMHSGEILSKYTLMINEMSGKSVGPTSEKDKTELKRECEQDVTKLMESYKYYGKDIDVNDWFKNFSTTVGFEEEAGKFYFDNHLIQVIKKERRKANQIFQMKTKEKLLKGF